MNKENFPLDAEKIEYLHELFLSTSDINDPYFSAEKIEKVKEVILRNLTPQVIFSLQMYIYNSYFWNTHIKDGNNLKDLLLFKPRVPRPEKPGNEPQEPNESDFKDTNNYKYALNKWEKETIQWKSTPEYKKRNEWTEKTERMKDILKSIVDL